MDVKGGVLYLDLTDVDLTSEDATNVPGAYDALTRTKGKPVWITCTFGTVLASGYPVISYGTTYNMTISAYSSGALIVIELVVDDDDDVTPTIISLEPAGE